MCQVLMIYFLMIMKRSCVHIRFNNPSRSNNYNCLCVQRLINILFLFLLQHLNWIERYSTMKIGRFFLFEYITFLHTCENMCMCTVMQIYTMHNFSNCFVRLSPAISDLIFYLPVVILWT